MNITTRTTIRVLKGTYNLFTCAEFTDFCFSVFIAVMFSCCLFCSSLFSCVFIVYLSFVFFLLLCCLIWRDKE